MIMTQRSVLRMRLTSPKHTPIQYVLALIQYVIVLQAAARGVSAAARTSCSCRPKGRGSGMEEHMSLISGMSWFPSAAGLRAAVRVVLLGLFLYTGPASSDDAVSVTVFSGETTTLPCSAPYRINNISEVTVEWTKPGLEDSYVLLFRDGRLDPHLQESSFKSRVDLADPELKNRNLSMILKKVMKNDEGLYECHFIDSTARSPTARQRRAISGTKPIQTIDLTVKEQPKDETRGDEKNEGVTAVIIPVFVCLAVVVVGVVRFFVYCKSKKCKEVESRNREEVVPENASLSGSKNKRV